MRGVRVVEDISPSPVSKERGLLGADGVVLGSAASTREARKDRLDQFLGVMTAGLRRF